MWVEFESCDVKVYSLVQAQVKGQRSEEDCGSKPTWANSALGVVVLHGKYK
jgi:hypothetical protein